MADLHMIQPGVAPAKGGALEVGNKAWNLMLMAQAGMPVPPAFVLPTSWCRSTASPALPSWSAQADHPRLSSDGKNPDLGSRKGVGSRPAPTMTARRSDREAVRQALATGIAGLETATSLSFGGSRRPLLVSVRSGAAVSMPGMMETVLDVGLNADTVEGLIRLTGNPRLAWDSYRRLVQGYAEVVAALPTAPFDALVDATLIREEAEAERELDHRALRTLTHEMLDCYRSLTGTPFPYDPRDQLLAAAEAVFRSWDAPKAASYRRMNNIADDLGTAVTVQTMVFGNAGGASGSGVGFTRDPATGARELYFDFQPNGQGEDVVAGRHALRDNDRLHSTMPTVWTRLHDLCHALEALFRDAQDFEFTVQSGVLYLLQARRAKRTDWAAVTIAADMVAEGLLQPAEALDHLHGIDLNNVVRTSFDQPDAQRLAGAEVAGIGVVSGAIALDTEAVKRLAASGTPAILVRQDTTTSDIEGLAASVGVLTASGGRTSHAAVVARQLGKVCLVGCTALRIDLTRRQCRIGDAQFDEGELLSLDGNTGAIYAGELHPVVERPERALAAIASWRPAKRRHAERSTH